MRTRKSDRLLNQMELGRVYRREELTPFSNAVDRDLKELVKKDLVRKAGGGLYYRPRPSRFGGLPAKETDVVRAFLKTDDFLMTSLNVFNQMGVGLTQLTTEYLVYNRKRVGRFELDGQKYYFKRPPNFPSHEEVNEEFHFVDLLNNYDDLSDPPDGLWSSLQRRVKDFSAEDLSRVAYQYGKASAQKKVKELLQSV